MNRECYLQHNLLDLLNPNIDPAIPRGWVKSVDLACCKWLRDRGLLDASLKGPAPAADARDLNTPLPETADV